MGARRESPTFCNLVGGDVEILGAGKKKFVASYQVPMLLFNP